MWRCAVLLSVCCVGLAAAQESDIDADLLSIFNLDCGTNEYFDQCSCVHSGGHSCECPPEKTCETRKIDIYCPEELISCMPKCVCKDGYYRKTEGGDCIPEEECGPACGENEEYTECANPCIDDSCAAMGSLKPNCTEPCVPGCVCKKDNFRQNEYYPCWPKCYCAEHRDSPECN